MLSRSACYCLIISSIFCFIVLPSFGADVSVTISADKTRIGMGRTVQVYAVAKLSDGRPASGCDLLPYVNGRCWGSQERSDEHGRARFLIPLPIVGIQEIEVRPISPLSKPVESWIWAPEIKDNQTIYLTKSFSLKADVSKADMWFGVDDAGTVYINGHKVIERVNWHNVRPVPVANLLHPGENLISVTAVNGLRPAGMLFRLEMDNDAVGSDASWRAFYDQPEGWPLVRSGGGINAIELGKPGVPPWTLENWPTVNAYRCGTLLNEDAATSNVIQVRVDRRKLQIPPKDPNHLIGVQWEPWFVPSWCDWSTAEAVPVMGYYSSFMPEVTRQHMIWLAESGADFLVTDWSNDIWQKPTWDDRDPPSNELIHSTSLAMEVLASMRDEGIPVPKMTLLTGISYAPNGEVALNGMLNWIYQMYIRNPRFKDLWVQLDGKPLILVLDCGAVFHNAGKKLDDRFTIRYNGANQESSHTDQYGFWSWMDGTEVPSVAMVNEKAEALTACIGYFRGAYDGGWKPSTARGRRGGATLLENWRSVLKYRPSFLQVHQFNEFAGQPEGQGMGPNSAFYGDEYSEELSDDFEPTSLTASAYRGNGGWGFQYLNLVRALVDLYRQPVQITTVLIVSSPSPCEVVKGNSVKVVWDAVGKPATGYTIQVNGKTVAHGVNGNSTTVDLSHFRNGPLTIRVTGENTESRYLLSSTEDSLPLDKLVAAYAEVNLTLQAGK
jgi:hypothetical protein